MPAAERDVRQCTGSSCLGAARYFLNSRRGTLPTADAAQEAPMSNPKNPNDPDSLSLAPGGGDKKADFSNVPSGTSHTEADAPKADFRNVPSRHGSTEEPIGEQTYTANKG